MKVFMLTAVIVIGICSCKKDNTNTVSPNILGKWEINKVYHGNINRADSTYKPGNGNILLFNSDSTYVRYAQGQITDQGIYHININNTQILQNFTNQTGFNYDIYFDNDASIRSLINIANDMLTLSPLLPDVGATSYLKIQN